MKKHCVTKRSPGCGTQRLLRCRSHPAGRGPNSSSLFPPLAAVVAVASGLTDGSRAVSTKKEDPLSELALQEGVFFLVSQMTSSISTFTIYSICHPRKSQALCRKFTELDSLQRAGFPLYNLSVSLRSTAPLVGEPLAKPFTLRGLPKPLPLGEVAMRSIDGEGKPVSREPPYSDKLSLCQSDAIAASALLRQRPCPLSHLR